MTEKKTIHLHTNVVKEIYLGMIKIVILCVRRWIENRVNTFQKPTMRDVCQEGETYTQRTVQPVQYYFTVQITGTNIECSL